MGIFDVASGVATGGVSDAIASVSKLFDDISNKIWPDPAAKASAEAMLLKANADAVINQLVAERSVMLAEANSTDKWTSRARPSFLYVMYLFMLAAIPFSLIWAFNPIIAGNMTQGVKLWLAAIPDGMWTTFQFVGGGYVVARTVEKKMGVAK